MYDPAPVRPRKTDFTRTRAGCMQCRKKRRKCDQEKPACRRCVKGGVACDYVTSVEFRNATTWAAERVWKSKQPRPTTAIRAAPSCFRGAAGGAPPRPRAKESAHSPEDPPTDVSSDFPGGFNFAAEETAAVSYDAGQLSWRMRLAMGNSTALIPTSEPLMWEQRPAMPSPRTHSVEVWASAASSDSPPILDWGSPHPDTLSLSHALGPHTSDSSTASSPPSSLSPFGFQQQQFLLPDEYSLGAREFASDPVFPQRDQRLLRSPRMDTPSPLGTSKSKPPTPMSTTLQDILGQPQEQGGYHYTDADREAKMAQTWMLAPTNTYKSRPPQMWSSVDGRADITTSFPVPSPPRALSTAREIAVGDRIYLAHFTLRMADVLPPQLRYLQQVATNAEPMLAAVLGLAASNMANLQGTQEHDQLGKSRWVPKESHQKQATKLISRALHLVSTDPHMSRLMRLGIAVLLAYSQLEFGTLADLFGATRRLEAIILDAVGDTSFVEDEHVILQGWSYLRAFCKRVYPVDRPYGIESRDEHLLDTLEERVASPSHLVDLIRVDALHLTYRIYLYRCMRGHGSSPKDTLRNISMWWSIVKDTIDRPSAQFCEDDFDTVLGEDEAHAALLALAHKLEGCDVPQEFPVDVEVYPIHYDLHSPLSAAPTSPPYQFSSHERAMECIDYAFARLVCDPGLLERAVAPRPMSWTPGSPSPSPTPPNPWLALILRIAASLDPAECARRNTYRTGVIGQVMRASLLCGEPAGLQFLDSFLKRMMASNSYYEDVLTPVHLSYIANQALIKEYALGRHVFYGGVTYSLWTGKDVVFSKGEGEYFIICGREKDGRFFNDCVPLVNDS